MFCFVSRSLVCVAILTTLSSTACVDLGAFNWLAAEWDGCDRVAVRRTEITPGTYAEETIPCAEVLANGSAGTELVKACTFPLTIPPQCSVDDTDGGADTFEDADISADIGPEETLDSVDSGDSGTNDGFDDSDASDSHIEETSDVAPEIDVVDPVACAASAPLCYEGIVDGGACTFVPTTDTCDDGNPCTLADACSEGACTGQTNNCDDGIPCTVDTCDATTGVCSSSIAGCDCTTDAACDDGNECTTHQCSATLECESSPVVDGPTCGVPGVDSVVGVCASGTCAGVKQISAGLNHTCARLPFGEVRCWGANLAGELGIGSGVNGVGLVELTTPTPVPLAGPAIDISAGANHTCAIIEGGVVQCWGAGGSGRLGSGSEADLMDELTDAPSTVDLDGDVATDLACGFEHSCALTTTGTVRCWGNGAGGALGSGSTTPLKNILGQMAAVLTISGTVPVEITAGVHFTCVRTDLGTVRCWGLGENGRLGTGNTANILDGIGAVVPSEVPLVGSATQLASGFNQSCAIVGGYVQCWGMDEGGLGQTGANSGQDLLDGSGADDGASIVDLGPIAAVGVASSQSHGCAYTAVGELRCWGSNHKGQVGLGAEGAALGTSSLPATNPLMPGPVTAVALGFEHTCAIAGGQVVCFGDAFNAQLGYGGSSTLGDDPDEIPTTYVNLMGVEQSHCNDHADCLSNICQLNTCKSLFNE